MTFLCIRSEFMTTFRRSCFFIVTFVLQILGYLWALKEILSYQHHFSFCTSSLTPIGWSCLSVHPSTGRKVHNGLMECFRFFFWDNQPSVPFSSTFHLFHSLPICRRFEFYLFAYFPIRSLVVVRVVFLFLLRTRYDSRNEQTC